MARATRSQGRHKAAWAPSPEQLAIYEAAIRGDMTQRAVAKQVGCAESNISRLISRIDRWLVPQFMDRIREIKANHTSRLMYFERQAMAEWHRSKKVKVTKKVRTSGQTVTTEEIGESVTGDPRYLQTAMDALEQVRVMWGMNEPEKIQGETLLRVGGVDREQALRMRLAEVQEAYDHARVERPSK